MKAILATLAVATLLWGLPGFAAVDLGGSNAAFAQEADYPPGEPDEESECVGEECQAVGFGAGATVEWTVTDAGGTVVCEGTATADSEGVVNVDFETECDLAPGDYDVRFAGQGAGGEDRVVNLSFTVEPAPGAKDKADGAPDEDAGDDVLSRTGQFITNGVVVGFGLVLLGAAVVFGVRRRRSSSV